MQMIVLRSRRSATGDKIPVSARTQEPLTLSLEVEEHTSKAAFALRTDPEVVAAAPPMPVQLIKAIDGSATGRSASVSWGVEAVGAAKSAFTGSGMTVAVLDTGIDKNWKKHPAFAGVDVIPRNFTSEVDEDTNGHGTHCAGTIFGRDVDGCRIGVAPGVARALVGKVLGEGGGSTDAVFRAILWALEEGAHVISMSLGMDFPAYREELAREMPSKMATSMALTAYSANVRLFDRLSQLTSSHGGFGQGCVVVAAAGNESRRDESPRYRIGVAPPAVGELILSVAALGQCETDVRGPLAVAPFSNIGARLAAPGVNIVSAAVGGGLSIKSGTSMAAPHVAGVAALWAQKLVRQRGRFQASQVISLLEHSTIELPHLDADDVGLGLVQAPA